MTVPRKMMTVIMTMIAKKLMMSVMMKRIPGRGIFIMAGAALPPRATKVAAASAASAGVWFTG